MANSCPRYPLGLNPFEKALLTPGPLGHNDAASPDSPVWLLGDTPGPLGINDHADPRIAAKANEGTNIKKAQVRGAWDPEAAASFLMNPINGWTGTKSQGRCARAVRMAINAGNVATPNNPVPASEYQDFLPTLGFVPVNLSGYKPEVGDIAVFPAIPGTRLEYGHIEMYTGERWQSDYLQPQKPNDIAYGNGFFANQIWTTKPFTIFRKRGSK